MTNAEGKNTGSGGLVPIKDFAAIYGVTPGRVAQMIKSGELVGIKVNGRWFMPVSEHGRELIEGQKAFERET